MIAIFIKPQIESGFANVEIFSLTLYYKEKGRVGSNQTDIRFLGDDFNRYYQRCVLFAKSYTYDSAQAECMAAEAMAVLWEKMAAGEQVDFVLPFLFSVILQQSASLFEAREPEIQIHGSTDRMLPREIQFRINTLEACDPHALYAEDVQTILHKSLDVLGRQTRRVFMLSRFEGMSNRADSPGTRHQRKERGVPCYQGAETTSHRPKGLPALIYLFLGI